MLNHLGNTGTNHTNNAVLVSLDFGQGGYTERTEELQQLVISDKIAIGAVVTGKCISPNPATLVGNGKLNEIRAAQMQCGALLVIFNHELSPGQQRNLSQRFQCQVVDRTSLILDIFAQRAQSHEGKLQVELAQLQHLSTRLVRGWTHLERQKGGIGLRGPGETQLETDRRLIGKRVKLLKKRLAALQRQRKVQRRSRQRTNVMSVSIVGYTNAGKSTLFNKLTRAHAYAADQLFATLDTTTRKLFISERDFVVVSDTVGFIRDLPHTLVASFSATLEETIQADILLHVIDASGTNQIEQVEAVNNLLKEINADAIPQILVLNKIDLDNHSGVVAAGYKRDEYGRITRIRTSAKTGEGISFVKLALAEAMARGSEGLCKETMVDEKVTSGCTTAYF